MHQHQVAACFRRPSSGRLEQCQQGPSHQKPDLKGQVCLKQINHFSGVCDLDTRQLPSVRERQGASKLN